MNSTTLRKLRQVEKEIFDRNYARRSKKIEPSYVSKCLYNMYAWVFYCRRSVIKTLFQEDAPRKVFEIEVPLPKYPWLCVYAGDEDVTDVINQNLLSHVKLSQDLLEAVTGIRDVEWSYVDSQTFEVVPIVSPDEVKDEGSSTEPSTDTVSST